MNEKTLATFKIEVSQWELFKTKVSDSGSNATQTILDLISAYLDDRVSVEPKIGEETLAVIDKRVDAAISPLKAEFEAMRAEIASLIKLQQKKESKSSEDALQGASKSVALRSHSLPFYRSHQVWWHCYRYLAEPISR